MISIFDVASTNNNLLSGGNIQYQVSCWWLVSPSHRQQTYMENILLRLFTTGAQPCLHLHSNQISQIQLFTNCHILQSLWNLHLHLLYVNRNLKRKMQSKSKCLRRESKLLTFDIYVSCSWYCKTLTWHLAENNSVTFWAPSFYSFHLV